MVRYRSVVVNGVRVFYREAGAQNGPTILLLHGFPASSHMFRDLMTDLQDRFRLIAPDYPGFGQSDAPRPEEFAYTFDHLASTIEAFVDALGLEKYTLFVQDYGAPIGFRVASRRPERVRALLIQNGIAHPDGITEALAPLQKYWQDPVANEGVARGFLHPDTTKFQYLHGTPDVETLSPDAWTVDQAGLDRIGNDRIQLALLLDYQNNVPEFAKWQAYFREHQPPALLVWGKNDPFFSPAGASAYARDLKNIETHLLDAGHFALESHHEEIAAKIRAFADRVAGKKAT